MGVKLLFEDSIQILNKYLLWLGVVDNGKIKIFCLKELIFIPELSC